MELVEAIKAASKSNDNYLGFVCEIDGIEGSFLIDKQSITEAYENAEEVFGKTKAELKNGFAFNTKFMTDPIRLGSAGEFSDNFKTVITEHLSFLQPLIGTGSSFTIPGLDTIKNLPVLSDIKEILTDSVFYLYHLEMIYLPGENDSDFFYKVILAVDLSNKVLGPLKFKKIAFSLNNFPESQ